MLVIIEVMVAVGWVWFVATQIIEPLFHGTRPFPMFRKRGKLQGEVVKAREEVVNRQLEDEAEFLRTQSKSRK
jgi:hypothetical protein